MLHQLFTFIGGAVCHQLPERSIMVGGKLLPLCARCTGIYTGIFLSFVWIWFSDRKRGNQIPPMPVVVLLALSLAPFMIDGGASYLGLWKTNNLIRILTGISAGYAFPYFFFLIMNYDVYGDNREPLVKKPLEVLWLFCAGIVFSVASWRGLGSYYINSFILASGVFLMFSGLLSAVLKVASSFPNRKIYCISMPSAVCLICIFSMLFKGGTGL